MTYPTVYPTGATVYHPAKCFNGYTIFQAKELGALIIDMNGGEVKLWKGFHGFPNKMLPGGFVIGHSGERSASRHRLPRRPGSLSHTGPLQDQRAVPAQVGGGRVPARRFRLPPRGS